MSLGLSRAGIKVIGAIDNDPKCQDTYKANHPGSKFILADITETNAEVLEEELKIKKDDDNLLFVGCSPCQYWSIITGRITDSTRKDKARPTRNLLGNFSRFVEYYRPGYVMIENVVGIQRNREESGLARLVDFLSENGYGVPDEKVMVASRYGVPQSRRRYVLVASRVKPGLKIPKPSKRIATVREHIGKEKLPKIEAGVPSEKLPFHRSPSLSDKNIRRMEMTPEGGTRESWANGDLQIPAYKDKPISFFRENYGRMSWDKPAPTITTKFYSIGSGRFGHPDTEQNRTISLLEGALLQTFPKRYKFKNTTFQVVGRLIGNAVPPRLAQKLGKALVNHASGKK